MDPHPQSARAIVMVRPASFGFNEQTAGTNLFQTRPDGVADSELQPRALAEFDAFVEELRRAGVQVIVVEDLPERPAPDAVFPNNWISMHGDGTVVVYPMYAPVRRLERRNDLIETLKASYGFDVRRVVDLTSNEAEARFLEGTGSLVFDYPNRCVYASLSPRTDPDLARMVAEMFGYDLAVFHATDARGMDVYHTNVVLSIGERFAVVCDEAIEDSEERKMVLDRLASTGREIVTIDREQMARFAANILEVEAESGEKILIMSKTACAAYRPDQIAVFEKHARIVTSPLDTIETVNGGSARCMIAAVHLPRLTPEEIRQAAEERRGPE